MKCNRLRRIQLYNRRKYSTKSANGVEKIYDPKWGKYLRLLPSFVLLVLAACSTSPERQSVHDETFVPEKWKTIAVLSFTGDAAFSRPAAEFFANKLQKQQSFRIITPGFAEIVLERKGFPLGTNEITIEEAQKAGRLVEAQSVFMGKIEVEHVAGPLNRARAEIKLIDVSQNRVVASVVQPNSLLVPSNDSYDLAKNALDRAAAEMMTILDSLAKKNR